MVRSVVGKANGPSPERRASRAFRRLVGFAALVALALPASAGAHVQLSPDRVEPGSFTLFTVLSPNESEQPLTGLRLDIPEGIVIDSVADTPGFTAQIVEDKRHRVAALSWQGGRIEPARLGVFRFSAGVGAAGTLQLTGIQRFADGSTKTWHTAALTVAGASSGRDGLTLAIAVVALALALGLGAALAVVLARDRRAVR